MWTVQNVFDGFGEFRHADAILFGLEPKIVYQLEASGLDPGVDGVVFGEYGLISIQALANSDLTNPSMKGTSATIEPLFSVITSNSAQSVLQTVSGEVLYCKLNFLGVAAILGKGK